MLLCDGHGRQDRWTFPNALPLPAQRPPYVDTDQATALATAGSVNPNDYEAYSYDANGNRTSLRKRDGSMLGYSYDALNRMTLKTVPERPGLSTTHTRDVHYGYDLRNLQLSARFDSASGEGVTNSYDGFGRLNASTLVMAGVSRTLAHLYDREGNRTRLTHPDGQAFTFAHDALGRLTAFYQGADTSVILGQFAYNTQGLPASRIDRPGSSATWSYDSIGRLSSMADAYTGGAGNVNRTFGYNPASQVTSQSRDNDAYAWTGHYAVSRTYLTDGLNRYTAAGSASFAYDLNGNLTGDGSRTFTYDIENRLVGASGGVTLRYDPLGRLYEVAAPSGTTQFLYDGDALVGEYLHQPHSMTNRYLHGSDPMADDPLIWFSPSAVNYLHRDHQGSIVAAAANAGTVVAINRYDEYGIPASTNVGRFQYTGQIWLPDLGMYYYKARIMSPTLGRFLQTDPVGYEDQFNLYTYVGNDPVNMADPTGKRRCSGVIGCIVAGVEASVREGGSGIRGGVTAGASSGRRAGRMAGGIRGVAGGAILGISVNTIVRSTREDVVMNVYRIFDGRASLQNGRGEASSWTLEDPRHVENWRDRFAIYPAWNAGTYLVEGQITMQDMSDGNVEPGPGPNSTAGYQPADPARGGGPYAGEGNEIIIRNSVTTVKEQRVEPFEPR